MKLPYLSDTQLVEFEKQASLTGIKRNQCPTCLSLPDDFGERADSTYRCDGVEYPCNCSEQIRLFQHYTLANIPLQYQRLNWKDYQGDPEIGKAVDDYLDQWQSFKLQGIGIAFMSKGLGTGKTYAATAIGRFLIRQRELVYFCPFNQLTHACRYNDEEVLEKLNSVNVAILDDIIAPPHSALNGIFADNLEDVIRNRTNYNGVTLITTNLTVNELQMHYPRVWSLLDAKQMVVEMENSDARQGFIGKLNLERALAGEVAPIN